MAPTKRSLSTLMVRWRPLTNLSSSAMFLAPEREYMLNHLRTIPDKELNRGASVSLLDRAGQLPVRQEVTIVPKLSSV